MARKPKPKTPSNPDVALQNQDPAPTENSIEQALAPDKPQPKRTRRKPEEQAPAATDSPRVPAANRPAAQPLPQSVRERFIVVGDDVYFPDGTPAFADRGNRLTTKSENTEVIRGMVEVAQQRGWNVVLKGTERFRAEAWFAASLAGLAVQGYEPSAFERERMVRAIARRQGGAEANAPGSEVAANGRPGARANHQSPPREVPSNAPAIGESPSPRAHGAAGDPRQETAAYFKGRLVDHGASPYKRDPKEPMSYFVRLETPHGDREAWGVDLERAVKESLTHPRMGDVVTAKVVGQESVKVPVDRYDEHGQFRCTEQVSTHRNVWVVERSDFLEQRATLAKVIRDSSITAEAGAKRHPELLGTYVQLQIAQKGAERDIALPKDREVFVARVREALAQDVERGKPMEPVPIRERPKQHENGQLRLARDRDIEPPSRG